jgi:four helix bundle protein
MYENIKNPIKNFFDLEVYQDSYQASLDIIKKIIPNLPNDEKEDLVSQMRRSCKAVPRLIAEGYGKRHQKKGFQKYLDDSLGESNEMIVNLCHCKDLYSDNIDIALCDELLDTYDKTSRKLFKLSQAWRNTKEKQL